jgi:hypothetical protein
MRMRIVERDLARRLRQRGYSYGQIARVVPASKGTLNGWLKDIELTRLQRQRILTRMRDAGRRGSQKGAWQNRRKSLERIRRIVLNARHEFPGRIGDPLFLTGIVLFWGEGAKTTRHFQFMNSDPNAIRTMIKWLTKCAGIPKNKIVATLYVHQVYAGKGVGEYWGRVTGLPPCQFRRSIVKATPHVIRKNPSYMGCCRLVVCSSEIFWRLRGWQEGLLRYLKTRAPVIHSQSAIETHHQSTSRSMERARNLGFVGFISGRGAGRCLAPSYCFSSEE